MILSILIPQGRPNLLILDRAYWASLRPKAGGAELGEVEVYLLNPFGEMRPNERVMEHHLLSDVLQSGTKVVIFGNTANNRRWADALRLPCLIEGPNLLAQVAGYGLDVDQGRLFKL